jgi:TolB-like protein/Tfp pilus assembly protein PilF
MLPARGSRHSVRPAAAGRVLVASALAALGVLASARPAPAQCPDGTPPPCGRPAAVRAAAAPAANSVAVMYLDNQSSDTSDAYLADGLTEEITTKLGQVGRLTVTSNTTMRRYRSSTQEPAALGRALRVAQLVSGSVRRSGHRIRVNVELLRARDGVQLWADSYDRTDSDLLAIEEEVARQVATAIAGRLLPDERASLAARPTRDPEAYDHYLRGNFLLAQRSPAAARHAIAEYQTAVARDPSFARALGRLGLAYSLFLDWGWPYPGLGGDSLLVLAAAAADRAVALDSLDADAWLARGYSLSYLHPTTFAGVIPALERAVALDPRNAEAHHQLAGQLFCLRRDSDAVREYRRALALDPGRGISWDNFATLRYYERRFDEARRLADSGLAAEPRAYYLYVDRANLGLTAGDFESARADVDAAVRTRPADYGISTDALVAALEAHAGDTAAARARLEGLASALPDRSHPDYSQGSYLALGFLRSGARGRALDLLEAVRPRGLNFGNQLRDPGFDPIRDDPRFQALVAQTRPPEAP